MFKRNIFLRIPTALPLCQCQRINTGDNGWTGRELYTTAGRCVWEMFNPRDRQPIRDGPVLLTAVCGGLWLWRRQTHVVLHWGVHRHTHTHTHTHSQAHTHTHSHSQAHTHTHHFDTIFNWNELNQLILMLPAKWDANSHDWGLGKCCVDVIHNKFQVLRVGCTVQARSLHTQQHSLTPGTTKNGRTARFVAMKAVFHSTSTASRLLSRQINHLQKEDVPLVEFMYLVFACMSGESYHRRLRYLLLCLCGVFQVPLRVDYTYLESCCRIWHKISLTREH